MQKKDVTPAFKVPILRLVVTDSLQETDEDKARKFADFLERQYELASPLTVGGLRFSNCIEVEDYPEEAQVNRAMEILKTRGFDAEPTDCSSGSNRRGVVWITPDDPHR